jgi:hypothetical protein
MSGRHQEYSDLIGKGFAEMSKTEQREYKRLQKIESREDIAAFEADPEGYNAAVRELEIGKIAKEREDRLQRLYEALKKDEPTEHLISDTNWFLFQYERPYIYHPWERVLFYLMGDVIGRLLLAHAGVTVLTIAEEGEMFRGGIPYPSWYAFAEEQRPKWEAFRAKTRV